MAADIAGNLFVVDAVNHTIRKVTPARAVTTIAGVAGVGGFDQGDGVVRLGDLEGIAVDSAGNVYFGDVSNFKIRVIATTGSVSSLQDALGGPLFVNTPVGMAVDGAGLVYVADANANVVDWIGPTVLAQISATTASAIHGQSFSYLVVFSGISSGSFGSIGLPQGLHIDSDTGLISGVPTVVAGNYSINLSTVNESGGGIGALNLVIAAGQPGVPTISSIVVVSTSGI